VLPAISFASITKLLAVFAVKLTEKLQAPPETIAVPKEVVLSAVPSLFASA